MLKLDKILNEKGMSLVDLEERMRKRDTPLSRISISKIVKGESSPKVSTLEDIANALDMDVRDMFYSKDNKSKDELIDLIINSAQNLKNT